MIRSFIVKAMATIRSDDQPVNWKDPESDEDYSAFPGFKVGETGVFSLFGRNLESIPDIANRLNETGVAGVVFDF